PLLDFCCEVYTAYQRRLVSRSAVDFDDLIQLALQALQSDPAFLQRLQQRWPFILEDEAQDSTRLQEEVLRTLCGADGNWVRVGDPNQAINETFTTASPKFLRNFLTEPGVVARNLPESGRSAGKIRQLANFIIRWTMEDHPVPELRQALTVPFIQPPPPGDRQAVHAAQSGQVYIHFKPLTPEKEVELVINNIRSWREKPGNADKTVVILASSNGRGMRFVDALQKAKIPHIEILKNTQRYRSTLETIEAALTYLARPDSRTLEDLYKKVRGKAFDHPDTQAACKTAARLIQSCTRLEEYLSPRSGQDWLEKLRSSTQADVFAELAEFRALVSRWHAAVLLPIDQTVMTLAQDLFTPRAGQPEPNRDFMVDLALCERIARLLEKTAEQNPSFNLGDFADRLRALKRTTALNRFGDDEFGFNPRDHCGEVVVTTIHKAKGLEWDRVYLTSANTFDFPSLQPNDRYQSERGTRGRLNLEAEVLEKLAALMSDSPDVPGLYLEDGAASLQARTEYCNERLRLFYVAITRACSELMISYNTGRKRGNLGPCLPLVAAKSFLDQADS
ncbi:MAG TPA: ATP-dependent helicase, partial [Anaerolineaceae bacterium]|nr:ATP-dependent helicase [Anaerolineaceae bacterium]